MMRESESEPALEPANDRAARCGRRAMVKTIDLYVTRRFLGLFGANLLLFSMVYVLIDSLNQFESFRDNSDDIASLFEVALLYYFYELPGLFCQILGPVTTMASAMFTVTLMQRANELVPILAAGTSLQRTFLPILLAAALISLGGLGIQELWIPSHRSEIRAAQATGSGEDLIRHATHSIPRQNVFVIAKGFHPFSLSADGLLIFSLGRSQPRSFLVNAGRAWWSDPERDWRLENVRFQEYENGRLILTRRPDPIPGGGAEDDEPPPVEMTLGESFDVVWLRDLVHKRLGPTFEFQFTPGDLEVEGSQAMYSTLAELRHKIATAPDPYRWRMKYYTRFSDPLHHLILLLLGIPVVLWQGTRNVFLSSLLTVLISGSYFIAQAVAGYLGNERYLSPATAVWIVPIFFVSLGLTMYRGMRT